MLICFDALEEMGIFGLNGGEGTVYAKMIRHAGGKTMLSRLPAGSSIGPHPHRDNWEINYVLSGTGEAVCDGQAETLTAGCCHLCPRGSTHSIRCTGGDDLVLFTVVPEA